MQKSIDRVEVVHNFLREVFCEDLHAKRIESMANAAPGVVTGASLAVFDDRSCAVTGPRAGRQARHQTGRPVVEQPGHCGL